MLNEEKIKLMTKLALYEQSEGKKAIKSHKYNKGDYVSLNLIKSAVAITLAYLIAVALVVLNDAESFVNEPISIKLVNLAVRILVIYVVVFIIYMLITYMVASMHYIHMQEKNKKYADDLKELHMMYKREEKMKSELKLGGKDTDDDTSKY